MARLKGINPDEIVNIFERADQECIGDWLRVRCRPKLEEFHDTKNRQHPYRIIMQYVKDRQLALGKIKFLRRYPIVRAQVPPSWKGTGRQNHLWRLVFNPYGDALKEIPAPGKSYCSLTSLTIFKRQGSAITKLRKEIQTD
ncbi:hypothetical protein TNCV_4287831 [Trichonephila clavipes]|uniref:Uncharacterized protein n=1 Tax=Trichonephila clavipes TaxID=2585209 RepID=A0A8X6S5J7_TRICX|nr:hypothetical protein TNCV_4287831 [Trichonephila clavipes]